MKLHGDFAGLLEEAVNTNDDRLRQLDDHVAAIEGSVRDDESLAPMIAGSPRGWWAQRTIIKPPCPSRLLGGNRDLPITFTRLVTDTDRSTPAC